MERVLGLRILIIEDHALFAESLDLALSVVGLGATVVVVATGGSSLAVKAGAGLARGVGRAVLP